ncbi:MAG: hypothetical protein ACTHJJ_04765 [Intrasporangium sp.]|uniref:hypothetical protein n=1 Tax=Intrasporangium sp. TaxID=1925024 RepID=UPI003F7E35C9
MPSTSSPPSPDAPSSEAARPADRFFGLSTAQVAGSALAAATSALAASFLGVAGTIIGACVGSIVATIASAIYSQSLRRAGRRLRVLRPVPVSGAASSEPKVVTGPPRPADRRRWRPRVVLGVIVGAALALGAITGVEGVLGHPISDSSRGGTSLGAAFNPSGGSTPQRDRARTPAPSATTPDSAATDTATVSPRASHEPSSSASVGEATPSQTPTQAPTTQAPESRGPAPTSQDGPTTEPTP